MQHGCLDNVPCILPYCLEVAHVSIGVPHVPSMGKLQKSVSHSEAPAPSWRILSQSPESHVRLFFDQVFTWDDWARHRNANWRHRVQPTVFMRVALGYVWQLLLVLVAAVVVCLYQQFAVPVGAPSINPNMAIPFSAITFALSLLLVFKTNSSYGRWWEARIIWGQVVNYGRNFPRQLLAYSPPCEDWTPAQRDVLQTLLRWTAASVHVMRGHLTEGTYQRPEQEAGHLLTEAERQYLRRHWPNRALGVAHVLSYLSMHSVLGLCAQQKVALQEQLNSYVNCVGGCERIQRTPIPPAYTRHTSRMLMIYVTLAPVMLWPATGWGTPLVAPLIAFLLLGTENIGVMIEEPCRVLPLTPICRGIEAGINDLATALQLTIQPHITTHPTPVVQGIGTDGSIHNSRTHSGPEVAVVTGGSAQGANRASPTLALLTAVGLLHHAELLPAACKARTMPVANGMHVEASSNGHASGALPLCGPQSQTNMPQGASTVYSSPIASENIHSGGNHSS